MEKRHFTKYYGERAFQKVLWRKGISCGLCKHTKECHINCNFVAQKIVFFTHAKKMSFCHETLWVNIECPDVHQEMFSQVFRHFVKCYFARGCIYTHSAICNKHYSHSFLSNLLPVGTTRRSISLHRPVQLPSFVKVQLYGQWCFS
jgi:hypothetical protein